MSVLVVAEGDEGVHAGGLPGGCPGGHEGKQAEQHRRQRVGQWIKGAGFKPEAGHPAGRLDGFGDCHGGAGQRPFSQSNLKSAQFLIALLGGGAVRSSELTGGNNRHRSASLIPGGGFSPPSIRVISKTLSEAVLLVQGKVPIDERPFGQPQR